MAARRILLVEDSAVWRARIAALLLDEGYHVATAVQGEEGLANGREQTPELVLNEYDLPEIDASTLCRTIKQNKELRSIPVLSRFWSHASEAEGRSSGSKPRRKSLAAS